MSDKTVGEGHRKGAVQDDSSSDADQFMFDDLRSLAFISAKLSAKDIARRKAEAEALQISFRETDG